jgi:hypothetical protein
VGSTYGIDRPAVGFPVGNQGPNAGDRVVNVLREFVADRLADFCIRLADQIVGGGKPGKVGNRFQIPHDDGSVKHDDLH